MDGSKIVTVRKPAESKDSMELWQNVYIVGPEKNIGFNQMFARARCKPAESLEKADIVVFTGAAADVHPLMYGEKVENVHPSVYLHDSVDIMLEYIGVFQECLFTGTPMVGVCLGAQFLHVMNGGKLYQDVDNHNSSHPIWDAITGEKITEASSVHHQMCKETDNEEFTLIASAFESDILHVNNYKSINVTGSPDLPDIEAFWYGNTACLGVQGHPEYASYEDYTKWFLSQIQELIINNPDIEFMKQGVIRLKPEVLQRREYKIPETVHEFLKEYN